MTEKSNAQKLLVKPGMKILLADSPENITALLGWMPEDVILLSNPDPSADLILAFVNNQAHLETTISRLIPFVNRKAIMWIAYHKLTSKDKSNINRDTINAYAKTRGWQGIAMISLDESWSAMRLKQVT